MNAEIKKAIIDNENRLLANFPEYSQSIKQYIPRLSMISHDADFYNFILASFNAKKEQEMECNKKGFVSSRQLVKNLAEQLDMDDKLTPENLVEGGLYSYVDVSCLANNFNFQVGMYYLEKQNAVVIKTTVEDEKRPFNDRWLDEENKVFIYCMQKESDEAKKNCTFSHRSNVEIYKSIHEGSSIRVYVFMNRKKREPFEYAGVYLADGLTDENAAFIMHKKGFQPNVDKTDHIYDHLDDQDDTEIVINVSTAKKKKSWLREEAVELGDSQTTISVENPDLPDLPSTSLKVGKFIYTAMENLEKANYVFSEEQLMCLCDRKWSRDVLKTDYPFLVKFEGDNSIMYDRKGRIRYKKQLFTFSGNKYYVTKELWELPKKDNKAAFIKWYLSLKKGN